MSAYIDFNLLVPLAIFIFLIAAFFILRRYLAKSSIKSRVITLKGRESQGSSFIISQEQVSHSKVQIFMRKPVENLIDLNKKAIVRFKLAFEQCGWNHQIAPILVPIIKLTGILLACKQLWSFINKKLARFKLKDDDLFWLKKASYTEN